MLERYLIAHCSPTLASLKTANLFTFKFDDLNELEHCIDIWNDRFKYKGIELIFMRINHNGNALIYLCRKNKLKSVLNSSGVKDFLKTYGYSGTDVNHAINRLKQRLNESEAFPHEIGIFLGYPLGDVIGFIENSGTNSKCTGCWKVYCNECEAVRTFARFNKCTRVYKDLWESGRKSIMQLTVAS